MHVDRIQMITGKKIDLMIVDYADLLRPQAAERNSNSYSEAGSVYEELRGVAGELQIPVWSASQSNRGAHEEEVIQAHNVADSYRKIMTGDVVLSLSRKTTDKQASTARIHIIKNRFGADGLTFPTHFDSSNGDIKICDPSSPEGAAILSRIRDSDDCMRDAMKNEWQNMKRERKNGED